MNKIFYLILLTLLILPAQAQERREHRKMDSKIEQLEKVKLIEALDLTEDQSVRFFARRNEHRREIEKLEERSDELLRIMENMLDERGEKNLAEQKKLLNELLDIRIQIENKRRQFILSLNDILTFDQIKSISGF